MSAARLALSSSAPFFAWLVCRNAACNPCPTSPVGFAVAGTVVGHLGLIVLTQTAFKLMMGHAERQELLGVASWG